MGKIIYNDKNKNFYIDENRSSIDLKIFFRQDNTEDQLIYLTEKATSSIYIYENAVFIHDNIVNTVTVIKLNKGIVTLNTEHGICIEPHKSENLIFIFENKKLNIQRIRVYTRNGTLLTVVYGKTNGQPNINDIYINHSLMQQIKPKKIKSITEKYLNYVDSKDNLFKIDFKSGKKMRLK